MELDDRIPSVLVTLARIHSLLGNQDLALQEFHQALALDPEDAVAVRGLATFYKNSGRNDDAEKALQQAITMRPDDWYTYNELGAFYEEIGKDPQAISAYRQALRITPDNAEVWSNLGAAYLDTDGQQALAEEALRKSIALAPSYPAYANLGLLYLQQKRFSESAAANEQALREDGNNYIVWNNLMLAYQGSGQTDKAKTARRRAEELAEQAVQLKPRDAMAHSQLAMLYAFDKLNQKSTASIRTSLALAPDDSNVLDNVGEAYELLGNRNLALKYIEKSLQKGYALDNLRSDPNLQALVADPRFKPPGR
jgi:serine/threonine-protein kinase